MDYSNLAFLIGNAVGMVLKHKTPLNNKVIPWIILGVQLVVRFGAGVQTAGDMHQATFVQVGFWDDLGLAGQVGLWRVGQAVVDTGLAVLSHSLARGVQEVKRLGFRPPPKPPEWKW